MQVRVTEEGHLVIPPAIREELGIRPGTWLDVAANRGILQASVITSSPKNQTATIANQAHSRLATLKPHPDSVSGTDEDLDQVVAWDKSD